MNFLARFFATKKAPVEAVKPPAIRLPCGSDLWCRKRTSVSTMLDPELFARYSTGDDRIDEDWIVQSNPPCAFKAEFKEGCDALLEMLQIDPGLHATKGFLHFQPPAEMAPQQLLSHRDKLLIIVRTAERELKQTP